MEKRAIVFVVMTMFTLVVFQYLQPKPQMRPAGTAATNTPASAQQTASVQTAQNTTVPTALTSVQQPVQSSTEPTKAEPETFVTVDTLLYKAVFSTKGGMLKTFELKKYTKGKSIGGFADLGSAITSFDFSKYIKEDDSPIVLLKESSPSQTLAMGSGGDYSISQNIFTLDGREISLKNEDATGKLVFTYQSGNVTVKREYEFNATSYAFDLTDTVTGLPDYNISLGSDFGLYDKDAQYLHAGPVLLSGTDREEFKPGKVKEAETFPSPIKWIAIEDKYFVGAIIPRDAIESATARPDDTIEMRGSAGTHHFSVYGGPKDQDSLEAVGGDIKYVVDFGWTSVIARPIFWLLKKIYSVVGNYGVAIILLTIMIRVPFIPIVSKGQKSMKKMQEIQPKIKELQKQYKNDKERLNKEMMGIYAKHKVNPVGGCLPLLLQIPVFFALYKVLMVTIELRGAPFALWIMDLSLKDPYYITPILMAGTMFLQQKMTPTGGDERMKKMLMYMPLIFAFISLSFPSGLVLYWMVNNMLSIGQQVVINNSKD